jgi:gliding motility-associated-like protein
MFKRTMAYYKSLLFFLLLHSASCYAQLTVVPGRTAQQLAQELSGKGVTILNPGLDCAPAANAIFVSNNTSLGIDNGIVLTSGKAADIPGHPSNLASSRNNSPGDPDLTQLSGQTTLDACILEFDFIPQGDSVKFNYVFSSEEYINATCGPYNDVFGFFISGYGINGQVNIARVPGTGIPVAINSINNGIPGPGEDIQNCIAMGPGSPFVQYYINNTGSTMTHKGHTTVLEANYQVVPCSTYHLKIAIADAGNALYDSGVFLKAGSLQTNVMTVKAFGAVEDSTTSTPFIVKGCAPGGFVVSRPQAGPQPLVVNYVLSGTAINGTDHSPLSGTVVIPANEKSASISVQALPTTLDGVKSLTVKIINTYACSINDQFADSASLMIYDTLYARILTPDTTICRFQQMTIDVAGSDELTYSWSPGTGSDSTLLHPLVSPLDSVTYILSANWPGSGCTTIWDSIHINVLTVPFIRLDSIVQVCFGEDAQFLPLLDPDSVGYNYQWSGPESFDGNTLHTVVSNADSNNAGMYVLTVGVNNGCPAAMDSLLLEVIPLPPLVSLPSPYHFCAATVDKHLEGVGNDLRWYLSATGGTGVPLIPIDNNSPQGIYDFYVSQILNGCEGPRSKALISIDKCCEDNIFVPNAFTPNDDGRNDMLTFVRNDDHYVKDVKVFNRFGEIVFEGRGASPMWDGKYKGQLCDVGNYYFILTLKCNTGKELFSKGEMLLVR